jgi:hypothetical protein
LRLKDGNWKKKELPSLVMVGLILKNAYGKT